MNSRRKITIWVLSAALLIAVIVAILVPSSVDFGNLDFTIEDSNTDYQYEVGETLTFQLMDSSMFGREMVWYFGNGDSIKGQEKVEYHQLRDRDQTRQLDRDHLSCGKNQCGYIQQRRTSWERSCAAWLHHSPNR